MRKPLKDLAMNSVLVKTLLAAVVASVSFSVFATETVCTKEPKAKWMAEKDLTAKLVAQGLTVKRIKTEGSCYEAYVIDKAGKKSEMIINPVDGKHVGNENSESKERE